MKTTKLEFIQIMKEQQTDKNNQAVSNQSGSQQSIIANQTQ